MEEITIPKLEYEMMVYAIICLRKQVSALEAENLELRSRVELTAVKDE